MVVKIRSLFTPIVERPTWTNILYAACHLQGYRSGRTGYLAFALPVPLYSGLCVVVSNASVCVFSRVFTCRSAASVSSRLSLNGGGDTRSGSTSWRVGNEA